MKLEDKKIFSRRHTEDKCLRIFAWLLAVVFAFNTLYFVLRVCSPVIEQDSWYFLDAFLRKALNGTLTFGDFFVKRHGADHAQPLFKLEMLFEWRYFGLDESIGGIVGALAAMGSAIVLYFVLVSGRKKQHGDKWRYLAWVTVCSVLLSLNGSGYAWLWPLVALENVTTLIILLFMLAVWRAHQTGRLKMLAAATLFLCISSDDSALIAVTATIAALLLAQFSDAEQRYPSTWKLLAVIGLFTIVARVGYSFAPIVGGEGKTSLLTNVGLLIDRLRDGDIWKWAGFPLTLSVFYQQPFQSISADDWVLARIFLGIFLAACHGWFWWKAFHSRYNLTNFVAVAMMILTYGWIAGIVLGRVAIHGSDYLNQPRYTLLYAGNLIALLLMWAETASPMASVTTVLPSRRRVTAIWLPALCCGLLLVAQVQLSKTAWAIRPYQWIYDVAAARQIDELAADPEHKTGCLPELPVCKMTLDKRRDLVRLLRTNHLNVFSSQVQQRHRYLPHLPMAVDVLPPSM